MASLRLWPFVIALLIATLSTPSNAVAAINLTWNDNSNNETGFRIERKTGTTGTFAQIATTAANVAFYADTTVVTGTTYCYRVRANNGAGNSAYTNEACAAAPSLSTVTIAATTATAREAGPTVGRFTVTRTGSTAAPLTVSFGSGGTATAGSDYVSLPGAVTIPVGAATATITVTPINDTAVEADETVIVTLAAGASYNVGAPGSATVTIVSDDASSSLPAVSVSATSPNASEVGPTVGRFTVTRTGSTVSPMTVSYTTGGTATAGSDYTALPGDVTIPAGSATGTITVTPINDSVVESSETVIVTLSAGTGYAVGTPASATVTIASDDSTGGTEGAGARSSSTTAGPAPASQGPGPLPQL